MNRADRGMPPPCRNIPRRMAESCRSPAGKARVGRAGPPPAGRACGRDRVDGYLHPRCQRLASLEDATGRRTRSPVTAMRNLCRTVPLSSLPAPPTPLSHAPAGVRWRCAGGLAHKPHRLLFLEHVHSYLVPFAFRGAPASTYPSALLSSVTCAVGFCTGSSAEYL